MKIREQVPLAPLTTIGVGGSARYFVEAVSRGDVREAVDFSRSRQLPLFVLGGGSNLVIADEGFSGLVLKVALGGITSRAGAHGSTVFEAAAGEDWDRFVAASVRANCAGLECLSGIPGTVGGTPVQNVGAYGQEVAETLKYVEALSTTDGRVREFSNAECGFSYRTSCFNTSDRGRYVILRASFALKSGATLKLAYADLKQYFGNRADSTSVDEVRQAVLSIRRNKGMVLEPSDPDSRSAGSFFKNPLLSEQQHADVERIASARGLHLPNYPALAAQRKISAAWLVEQAGFTKGFARGAVGISTKHSLALVNRGGATAAELLSLKRDIQRAVADQFGIELQAEPVFLGFVDASTATTF